MGNQDLLYRLYTGIGAVQQLGHFASSLAAFKKALPVAERRAGENLATTEYQTYLGGTYCNIGSAEHDRTHGLRGCALSTARRQVLHAILQREREHALTRLFLRNTCGGRADVLGRLNRHAEAAESWQMAVELDAERRDELRLASPSRSTASHGRWLPVPTWSTATLHGPSISPRNPSS